MDSKSSWTPYYGQMLSSQFFVVPDSGSIMLKTMWGVTPNEKEYYGIYETDASCLIKSGVYLKGSKCLILNSVELQVQQMNALTSVSYVEL